jgi:glycosyltransferase involved in cell wall biosynthesis
VSGTTEPIRILRVIARLNMGGPALHVTYLTQGLASRGYATRLLAGEVSRGEDSMKYVAEQAGVSFVQIPQLHRELSPLHDSASIRAIVQEIRRFRPHILHTHTAKAGAVGRVAALLAGNARPPIIVHTFHGHVLRGYFDPVRTEIFRQTERRLARHTTRLVAVSPQVRDDLVELGVAPADRFSVVRLGIDLERRLADGNEGPALRHLFGVPDGRFVVGWIGRMTPIKRVRDVVTAFALLRRKGIEATLCLVGDGPDRELAELEARNLGIARDVLFVGYQRDVASYYSFFDTLVLASANEGTPVVAIEALGAGRPVVSSRVGGVADVVSDGTDGLLCDPGDVEGLATALAALATDHELRGRLGENGRARVRSRYGVDRLVNDIDLLYRELLGEQGLAAPAERAQRRSTA